MEALEGVEESYLGLSSCASPPTPGSHTSTFPNARGPGLCVGPPGRGCARVVGEPREVRPARGTRVRRDQRDWRGRDLHLGAGTLLGH